MGYLRAVAASITRLTTSTCPLRLDPIIGLLRSLMDLPDHYQVNPSNSSFRQCGKCSDLTKGRSDLPPTLISDLITKRKTQATAATAWYHVQTLREPFFLTS